MEDLIEEIVGFVKSFDLSAIMWCWSIGLVLFLVISNI